MRGKSVDERLKGHFGESPDLVSPSRRAEIGAYKDDSMCERSMMKGFRGKSGLVRTPHLRFPAPSDAVDSNLHLNTQMRHPPTAH